MKAKEIRSLSEEDMNSKVLDLQKELIKLNAQVATGTQIKNPGLLKKTKKTIARLKTILQEKKLGVKTK